MGDLRRLARPPRTAHAEGMPAQRRARLRQRRLVLAQRRSRRMRASQVDPEDVEAVTEMMELAEDEDVSWEEE